MISQPSNFLFQEMLCFMNNFFPFHSLVPSGSLIDPFAKIVLPQLDGISHTPLPSQRPLHDDTLVDMDFRTVLATLAPLHVELPQLHAHDTSPISFDITTPSTI